jgi:hypothetical protein
VKAAPPEASSSVPQALPKSVTDASAEVPKPASLEVSSPDDTSQHEALKNEITAEAESLDYTVSREQDIPRHGRIDLVLTRGNRSIACEISVTTPPEKEADHIRLRLKAGFQHVAVISSNRRKLELIQAAFMKHRTGLDVSKVGFYTPKEFNLQLFNWAADDPAGGKLEKSKPRKQELDLGLIPPTKEQREAQEREMLDELKRLMAGNRTT